MNLDPSSVIIDLQFLRCPLPVLRLRKLALPLESGTLIEALTTDPATCRDIPAFVREQGWLLEDQTAAEGIYRFRIRR